MTPAVASPSLATRCQNVKRNGMRCDAVLDNEGHHAATCECGGALDRRHNATRDMLAKRLAQDHRIAALTEQHCPQWDQVREGTMHEAILDIIAPIGNVTYYIDVTVVDVLSVDAALERQRAKRNGYAARAAEDKKLKKYPGATTIPFAIESYGRLGNSAISWLKRVYHDQPSELQSLLNELSALVQSHTAAMTLTACAAPCRTR